jgi:antitoxin (DNA-binding transcriptional repressor) of toxin-antitoxin stability system
MTAMKSVGVREFRDHATTYLSGREPIAINKHGRTIGYYIPAKRDEAAARAAVDRLHETVERILNETGMTEDELADLFDLNKPLPE